MLWDINIQKTYKTGDRHFAIDVCFTSDSTRLVLFGPSGAGKTQVLKMLCGLVWPDQGHVRFLHNELFNSYERIRLTPQQRQLAYVFQNYALFPHLTVVQNIAFSLQKNWLNPSKHSASAQVDDWLEKLELKPLAYQYPHQLSGGQAQRVALARALVMSPKAVLLDEPFSALDEKLRTSLRQELVDLQTHLATPMVLISHHPEDVKSFGKEIIYLADGKMVKNPG